MPPRRLNPPACVYVIELTPDAAKRAADRRRVARGAAVVYVGQSALPPRARLAEHKHGGRHTATLVRRYGRRILAASAPFSDRDTAEAWERRAARELRAAGFVVLGKGH